MEVSPIKNLIENFQKFNSDYDNHNLRESIDFNVFKFIESVFWIDEPKHSRIIAFLLNPEEIHGQRDTFLHLFLEMLGIKDFKENKWNVYAEKGNVDILITSNYPDKKTIIIENKSNWAKDQDCQMYRYWYQNIFKNNNNDIQTSFNTDNNRIIYLSPGEDKCYTPNSISRPESGYEDCIEILDEKIISTWYFHIQLKQWLWRCVEGATSTRLKIFIQDYIEFWDKTNNKEKTIMKELKDYFEDKEQDWKDFVTASEYIVKLISEWFQSFSQKLDSIRLMNWKFDKESNDFRWFLSDWNNSLSFVYEPTIGLTIWKSEFKKDKKEYESRFEEFFANDFDLEEDATSNYVMNFKDNESIIYNDTNEFHWIMGNKPELILDIIEPILKTYMGKEEVVNFFKDINDKTKS